MLAVSPLPAEPSRARARAQLEKSRVAHQLPEERNFHIFYQLCTGMRGSAADALRIPADALTRFRYLSASGCTAIAGVSDAEDFAAVAAAMGAVGITVPEQARRGAPAPPARRRRTTFAVAPCAPAEVRVGI